jgi:hypothetical protein
MKWNEGYWGGGISIITQNFPKSPSILFHPLQSSISQTSPERGGVFFTKQREPRWVTSVGEGNQGGSVGGAGAIFYLAGWVHYISDSASSIRNLINSWTIYNFILKYCHKQNCTTHQGQRL